MNSTTPEPADPLALAWWRKVREAATAARAGDDRAYDAAMVAVDALAVEHKRRSVVEAVGGRKVYG